MAEEQRPLDVGVEELHSHHRGLHISFRSDSVGKTPDTSRITCVDSLTYTHTVPSALTFVITPFAIA